MSNEYSSKGVPLDGHENTDDAVMINIGDRTMEGVFRATGVTNVHWSNLQVIFDRVEELLAEQCFSVKDGYEVGSAKVDADGNLQRIAEFSEAIEIRSADDVRREVLKEAASKGYIACAETRHVTLGDKVSDAILALIDTTSPSREPQPTLSPKPEPVALQYRYADPLTGKPVWRMQSDTWNGQRAKEGRPLYTSPPPPASHAEEFRKAKSEAWERGVEDLTSWLYENTSDGGAVNYREVLKLNPYMDVL